MTQQILTAITYLLLLIVILASGFLKILPPSDVLIFVTGILVSGFHVVPTLGNSGTTQTNPTSIPFDQRRSS